MDSFEEECRQGRADTYNKDLRETLKKGLDWTDEEIDLFMNPAEHYGKNQKPTK